MKEKFLRKQDIFLFVGILIIAGLLGLLCHGGKTKQGAVLRVTLAGELYGEYPLDMDTEISVGKNFDHNLFSIADGKVQMLEANCPDRYCVKQGSIQMSNETIICLPHRLVLEIVQKQGDDEALDAIVK